MFVLTATRQYKEQVAQMIDHDRPAGGEQVSVAYSPKNPFLDYSDEEEREPHSLALHVSNGRPIEAEPRPVNAHASQSSQNMRLYTSSDSDSDESGLIDRRTIK